MRIKLDITKSIEENASSLFETAKKARKKSAGAKDAVEKLSKSTELGKEKKPQTQTNTRKEHWYMKYRWFFTSQGNLAIGGRDADSNEEIIKKRVEPFDLIFHAEIPGSPFFVLKGKKGMVLTEEEKQEVAHATASYSRAWKYGVAYIDVFCVLPNQVSKKARAGEYVSKGSFMINGKKEFYQGELRVFLALKEIDSENYLMSLTNEKEDYFAKVIPGNEKSSDAAKEIITFVSKTGTSFTADEVISCLPPGNVSIEIKKK